MVEPTLEETEAFLVELTALSIKHKIEIAGCGCCGSPALLRLDRDGMYRFESGAYEYKSNLEFKQKHNRVDPNGQTDCN